MANKYPAHVRHTMGLVSAKRISRSLKPKDETILYQHPGKDYCIIFDIGAGNGKRCIQWLINKSNVLLYAFEPDPRQFAKLKKAREALDKEQQCRIQIYNVAVSDIDSQETEFYVCNDPSSSSLLPFVKDNIRKWKYPPGRYFFETETVIKVPTIRLDNFMDDHSVQCIDFLHIEAQGVVDKVIHGLTPKRLRHVKEILWKVHITDFNIYQGQAKEQVVVEHLRKNNFEITEKNLYSRNQEQIIRSVNIGWNSRGSMIYGFK